MSSQFAGQVVAITGAGSGIGAAIASVLADRGARVACLDVDETAVESVAAAVRSQMDSRAAASAWAVDVRDYQALDIVANQVRQRLGTVSGLVNAAGIVPRGDDVVSDPEAWRRTLDVNVVAVARVIRAFEGQLAATQGAIVNITSVEADRVVTVAEPRPTHVYAASKAALRMLTRSMAHELAPAGVRVNSVAPGPIATPLLTAGGLTELPQAAADRMLIKRLGQPIEVAQAVAFLLSHESSFVTGAELPVDGGWLAT